MTEPLPPAAPPRLWLRVLGITLVGALLGTLLSCLISAAWAYKWFNPWRALPAPPEPAISIAGASVDGVDIETHSGRLLHCEMDNRGSGDCWQEVAAAQTITDEGCEQWAQDARPQAGTVERVEVCENYADAGITVVYALRQNGSVYAWSEFSSAYDILVAFICVPLGAVAGGVVGLAAALLWRSRRLRRERA